MSENQTEITLGVLNAVEENNNLTQRRVASDLGVALGLVNSYLKRCIKKGFVKIRHAPANRYSYYLTPVGFSEKSRLTAEYLSSSFNFFRNARQECGRILTLCVALGYKKIVVVEASDLAEIIFLCAQDHGVEIIGVIDSELSDRLFLGIPVFSDLAAVGQFDAIVVADLYGPQATYDNLITKISPARVYTPSILGIKTSATKQVPADA